jgi:hypothetical protein
VDGPFLPFVEDSLRCGAARRTGHSLQTRTPAFVELTDRGTKRCFAAADPKGCLRHIARVAKSSNGVNLAFTEFAKR